MKIKLFLTLLFYQVIKQQACGGGDGVDYQKLHEDRVKDTWDYYESMFGSKNRGHFPVPDDLKLKYGNWILNFVKEKSETTPSPTSVPLAHEYWKLYDDAPYEGDDPPPWAYAMGEGRPLYCYYETEYGSCKHNWTRWAFNTYTNKCDKFTFSGCNGNYNNFVLKTSCERSCGQPARSSCDLFVDYVEDSKPYGVKPP